MAPLLKEIIEACVDGTFNDDKMVKLMDLVPSHLYEDVWDLTGAIECLADRFATGE